jgi:hypothetical protein
MSAIQSFFDMRRNYNLQLYLENLGCDLITIGELDENEVSFFVQGEKLANLMGRLPIIGRLAGPVRISYGAVKTPLLAIAFLFSVASAAFACPFNRDASHRYILRAKVQIKESFDGMKHIGRGVVETIPVVGCYQFVKYDNDRTLILG